MVSYQKFISSRYKVIVVALAVCAGLEASWTNQIIAGSLGQAGYSGDGGIMVPGNWTAKQV